MSLTSYHDDVMGRLCSCMPHFFYVCTHEALNGVSKDMLVFIYEENEFMYSFQIHAG